MQHMIRVNSRKRAPFGQLPNFESSEPSITHVHKRRRVHAPPPTPPQPLPWWKQKPRAVEQKPQPGECAYCPRQGHAACGRCDRDTCDLCIRSCECCGGTWCPYCTVVDYDCSFEQTLCFGCFDERHREHATGAVDSDGDEMMICSQ